MQVIPAVDILEGRVVRLLRGRYDRVTRYSDDPVEVAGQWVSQGADLVHVVDLSGARSGNPDRRIWEVMAAAGIPFQVGGGIRDASMARAALSAGARRVVMGTAAVWNPEALGEVGPIERVVAALDIRAGRARGAGWMDEGRSVSQAVAGLRQAGVGRLLVTGIERDGAMTGPDLELLGRVQALSEMAVIASGGVGDLADLEAVATLGCEAVIVGRALYERRFTLAEALSAST
ncbi:MAG: 1-(5-phosphoribosyl)-5-[(5-phosphoribosylamino)methylideneamino] imidazole-4-carboxamide isomerase [bacterium]|nr:1-(5-phosphoribosyl)-5-[(5-phosphoribosylamino)methylideneamino] imidazole-4-carboxamide isomerase [Acidimicrobiia bacterium]MCY4648750.1 1-(5-phosphoribosyl)-5-[(5-phosphoribosylamino)methylideneamino] imidazole-4-carboxamide isomerase [bacterium]